MAFDSLTLNAGSGGSSLATDTFTDTDSATKVMPYGGVAFGDLNGPYTVVTLTSGLPVQPQTGSTWLTADQATTTGGCSVYSFLSTAAVQAAQVKGAAGQVYGLHFFNNSDTIAYVRLYDQTGAPASGDTANIKYRAMVPASTSAAGFVVAIPPGITFATGIGVRVTAAIADNDTTALAANAVTGNVIYK